MTETTPTTLVLLHFLGGTADEWAEVQAHLHGALHILPLDLPGFGTAAAHPARTVDDMAAYVAETVRHAAPARWLLAGHSMGAKVAAALARRAADNEPGLGTLAGLVLIAGSPPAPEPMDEARRTDMLTWFNGTASENRAQAEKYIDANAATPLPQEIRTRLVQGVLGADRTAWTAWLEHGSREDWATRIGTLPHPALILAGAEDEDLGPQAQHTLMARHFTDPRVGIIPNAKHLLPAEAPAEIAARIAAFAGLAPAIPPAYAALIDSPRTDPALRTELWRRAAPDDPAYTPRALDPAELETLRAVAAQILPGTDVDWAARLDAGLAEGAGDGWRFADLPPDTDAYKAALETLDTLAGGDFAALESTRAHAILGRVAAGTATGGTLGAQGMQNWFKDCCADLVRRYAAHPATAARIGYSGIASGGPAHQGFTHVATGELETWEPRDATSRGVTPQEAQEPTGHHP